MRVALWPTVLPLLLLLLGLHRAGARSPSPPSRLRLPPPDQPARVARFVVNQVDWAAMATLSSRRPVVGQPFSNVFSVSDGPPGAGSGVPYMYLTRLELSVQDLQVRAARTLCHVLVDRMSSCESRDPFGREVSKVSVKY